MIEIHVVQNSNRQLYDEALDQQFRLRRDIYIGERRWQALQDHDGREIDQFDTPETTYILALNEAGEVVGGSRFHPSVGPTLLSEVFPQLANLRGIKRDDTTLEWTRFFVSPRFRGEAVNGAAAGALTCGCLQAALAGGGTHLTVVSETYFLTRFVGLGWRVRVLGEPIVHDGLDIVAFSIPIDEGMLEATRALYGIDLPRLIRRNLGPPLQPVVRTRKAA